MNAARPQPSEAAIEKDAADAWSMVAAEIADIKSRCAFGVDSLSDSDRKRLETWFEDEEDVEHVVDNLGGLWFLLHQEASELHTFTRREFLRLYAVFKKREAEEKVERALAAPARTPALPAPVPDTIPGPVKVTAKAGAVAVTGKVSAAAKKTLPAFRPLPVGDGNGGIRS